MPASDADLLKPRQSGLPAGPKNHTKTMQKRKGKSGDTKPENKWPEPQSARACAVETQFSTLWENSKFHRKCIHFSSLFLSFCIPFSSLFQKSRKRGPGSRPRVLKRHKNGSQGCPNGAPGCQNRAPRSPQVTKKTTHVYQGCQNGAPSVTMVS